MSASEASIARAERRVREAEERVGRQAAIADRLHRAGHRWAADTAKIVLATSEAGLQFARDDLRAERAWAAGGQGPAPT